MKLVLVSLLLVITVFSNAEVQENEADFTLKLLKRLYEERAAMKIAREAEKRSVQESTEEERMATRLLGELLKQLRLQIGVPIAFHVQKTEDFKAGGTGTFVTVPFEKVLLNLGAGWNSTSNKFVAPVRGVYHFSVQAYSSPELACWVWLTHNTNRVQKVDAPDGHWRSASGTIILQVEQFDLIYLQLEGGYVFRGAGLSHFSGFLLHRL